MLEHSRRDWIKGACAGIATCTVVSALPRLPALRPPSEKMIFIPGGPFRMGTAPMQAERLAATYGYHCSWLDGEVPQSVIHVPAFAIARYPVTNKQYAWFCADTGHAVPSGWNGGVPPAGTLDHPVTRVQRADAQAYAQWSGMRLPTEAEWEKAARGTFGRLYPWGDVFDPDACQWNRDASTHGPGTAPVTAHPSGASPFGVQDMVGNVAEWCADDLSPSTAVIKGGAWITENPINLRPAARNMSGRIYNEAKFYGFRCVRELP